MSIFGDKTPQVGLGGGVTTTEPSEMLSSDKALDQLGGLVSNMASKAKSNQAMAAIGGVPTTLFFPPEMIGGSCPIVAGEEEMVAWQAAAESCDSERIHFVHTIAAGRVWFLAVRSADLASHLASWCPFAALLPGQPAAEEGPICYIHISEDAATLLTITEDTLNVHRGATNVIQAKAERTARNLGGRIVQLLPDKIDTFTPVPWQSLSLLEDKARRMITIISALAGLALAAAAFVVWTLTTFTSIAVKAEVGTAQQQSAAAVETLMNQVVNLKVSKMRNEIANFSLLNEALLQMGGWLKKYEIFGGRVEWEALVPLGVTGDKITALGGRSTEVTPEGMVIVGSGHPKEE